MIRKIVWEQRINEKREYVFLVAGQILQVQEDLSLKTVEVLLVPFYPEGDYNFVSRECPSYGKYADDFWHNFDSITKGKTTFANLNNILPTFISESIKEAIPEFGKKIKGFD